MDCQSNTSMNNKENKKNDNSSTTSNFLYQLKNDLKDANQKLFDTYNVIDRTKEKIRLLERQIYDLCPHEWVRDYSDSGPYSRTTYLCKKCMLYK